MFTGLVETQGRVVSVIKEGPGRRIGIDALFTPEEINQIKIGDSIAVNGCCLTVVQVAANLLHFQAGPETLLRTNLGELTTNSTVNIERSLKLGDRLGGHFVTGHIDGVGTIKRREDSAEWSNIWFSAETALLQQMVTKGSIAIDGISLTVVEVTNEHFSVQLIPHTLSATNLGARKLGARVNLETDLLAKYVARQIGYNNA